MTATAGKSLLGCLILLMAGRDLQAQFLMDMLDTTKAAGRGLVSMYRRFDHLRVSGYIQAQYQRATSEGADGYSGGDFSEFSDNRFMLRRGRIRFDYARYDDLNRPRLQFVFQFDGTERGVFIRDFWGRVWDRRSGMLSLTTGMFARPFGYEVNLSSADREAPERGRMSQILMRTERDLGVMGSLEPPGGKGLAGHLKIDFGIFNGQGLAASTDFDGYKDLIGQIIVKPWKLSPYMTLGGGISFLKGGLRQFTPAAHRMAMLPDGMPGFQSDTRTTTTGARLPRGYRGMNLQWKWRAAEGAATELRAEIWRGVQTATRHSSETPGNPFDLTGAPQPFYVREFQGGFLLFLQQLGSDRHQLGLKFDWYDPNRAVRGAQIGRAGADLGLADLRFATLGLGYNHYMSENLRLTLWYDRVRNETSLLPNLEADLPDDVLTLRLQYRF
jgi:hypothetical protein